jgi:hypothetical protein
MGDGAQPGDQSSASQLSSITASALRVLIVDDNADAAEMLEKAGKVRLVALTGYGQKRRHRARFTGQLR